LYLTGIQSVFVGGLHGFAAVNMLHVPLKKFKKKHQRLYYTAVDRAEALRGIDNSIRLVIQLAYRAHSVNDVQTNSEFVNVRRCENVTDADCSSS
jgi:hypothetical protein